MLKNKECAQLLVNVGLIKDRDVKEAHLSLEKKS